MRRLAPIALIAALALALALGGCSSGDSTPGETVPGPPRALVDKGSKPPAGGIPPQAQKGSP